MTDDAERLERVARATASALKLSEQLLTIPVQQRMTENVRMIAENLIIALRTIEAEVDPRADRDPIQLPPAEDLSRRVSGPEGGLPR